MIISFYSKLFNKLPYSKEHADKDLNTLSTIENARLLQLQKKALFIASILGALGVVLLYVPYYVFPYWFTKTKLSLFGKVIDLPIRFWTYSVVLVIIEIILLTITNLWVIKNMAYATGYNRYNNFKQSLLQIGMEKKASHILEIGINPLQGLNPFSILTLNALFILKATLTNIAGKIFIQRVFGRYAAQALQDFVGIPIFAFWNAWAMQKVLNNARVIILGKPVIDAFLLQFKDVQFTKEQEELVYDTLQFIAISKRDFHYNHYVLSNNIFSQFNITIKPKHEISNNYLSKLTTSPHKHFLKEIIALGFILDGKISSRERKRIMYLNPSLHLDYNKLKAMQVDFIKGKLKL